MRREIILVAHDPAVPDQSLIGRAAVEKGAQRRIRRIARGHAAVGERVVDAVRVDVEEGIELHPFSYSILSELIRSAGVGWVGAKDQNVVTPSSWSAA